jgi:hypothetical protein
MYRDDRAQPGSIRTTRPPWTRPTYEDLSKLDKRLKNLPSGFNFRTNILDRDLVIKAVDGKARIMWDERGGSWYAWDPVMANYQP